MSITFKINLKYSAGIALYILFKNTHLVFKKLISKYMTGRHNWCPFVHNWPSQKQIHV